MSRATFTFAALVLGSSLACFGAGDRKNGESADDTGVLVAQLLNPPGIRGPVLQIRNQTDSTESYALDTAVCGNNAISDTLTVAPGALSGRNASFRSHNRPACADLTIDAETPFRLEFERTDVTPQMTVVVCVSYQDRFNCNDPGSFSALRPAQLPCPDHNHCKPS